MSEEQPDPLNEDQLDHIKFFVLFLTSFFLAENIVLTLNQNIPALFTPFQIILQDLTLEIFTALFILVFARIIANLIPELNTTKQLPVIVGIISSLIVSHPLYISISGSTLTVEWLVINMIENRQFLQLVLELILFSFVGYALILIQARLPSRQSRYHKILRYVGQEITTGLFIFMITYYLIRSFIRENFESLTLTTPVRLLLILLFYISTTPLQKANGDTNDMGADKQ